MTYDALAVYYNGIKKRRGIMKFLHLGDLHLGRKLNEISLKEDQQYMLDEIINLIKQKGIDAVLISGDIYDRSMPNEDAVELFDYLLTQLHKLEIKVFVYAVRGNHDSAERLNFASGILNASGIHIAAKYDGSIKSVSTADKYGKINIWLMPYIKKSLVEHYCKEEGNNITFSDYEEAIKHIISKCNINTNERNIIVAHQYVTGENASDPKISGSDGKAENTYLTVGTIDKINYKIFDDFDYVALGHIHSPQQVGRNTCRYAGSPLKYSVDEREINSEKVFTIVDVKEKGNIDIEILPVAPLRNVRQIKGPLNELIENATGRDDYICAVLTDSDMVLNAVDQLREVYPNLAKTKFESGRKKSEKDIAYGNTNGKSFMEIAADFYSFITGEEPTVEELDILEDAAEEAGIIK